MRQIITFNNKNWELPAKLPYTEYKYLYMPTYSYASGTVFDTGYKANANTKIEFNFILTIPSSQNGNGAQGILGSRIAGGSSDPNAWFFSFDTGGSGSRTGRFYGNTGTGAKYAGTTKYNPPTEDTTVIMTMSTVIITYGNTTKTIDFTTSSRGTASRTLKLCGWDNEETNKYLCMTGWYGETKISENNILLHDFVPAVRNTDNIVGLLDKVTNNFIQPIDQNYLPTATNTI